MTCWRVGVGGLQPHAQLVRPASQGTGRRCVANVTELLGAQPVARPRKVVVVGIVKEGEVEIAAAMVAVLPDDPASRKALIDWENKLFENEDDDVVKDLGQKYMYLAFD